ncbi:hypothetical protein M7775_19195 [Sporomusa sphaeroides DSM 2875]|uniref:hypothetical protein n=1 Tax=Sporomusa sphaeroides TaxID=47679 RepID=UPI00202ED38F|nr:hypothetical protein [Sporomusa sphaeroides]MCM0760680.1 hypothetical protein [Sporomusa sphaeroides DSM 2875]
MKWYWVLILCWIAAGTGLMIGCMCRVAGRADEQARQATGGKLRISKAVDLESCYIVPNRQQGKSIIKLAAERIKALRRRKKFRWKNYYRAKRLCRNGNPIAIGR